VKKLKGGNKMLTFWDTVRGVRLADMLQRELPRLAEELKRANDLKEEELKIIKEKEGK
jgi:hypothetical protein